MKSFVKNMQDIKKITNKSIESVMNTITLIFSSGKSANIKNNANSELRDVKFVSPYGISSSGYNGLRVAIVYDGDIPYIVGVYDQNKPEIDLGTITIYNEFGVSIDLNKNGEIIMNTPTSSMSLKSDGFYVNDIKLEDIIDSRIP